MLTLGQGPREKEKEREKDRDRDRERETDSAHSWASVSQFSSTVCLCKSANPRVLTFRTLPQLSHEEAASADHQVQTLQLSRKDHVCYGIKY